MNLTVADVVAASNLEAREYQERVVTKTVEGFTTHELNSQMINAPTGAGKTFMALLAAKILQKRYGCGVGWTAMRRNLLGQCVQSNIDSGINVEGLTPISMFDRSPPTHDENGEKIELLIEDECHHSAASSAITIMDTVNPRFRLGLSGTPYRTDKIKLCFQRVIRDCGIRQLVEAGYLSQYRKYVLPEWSPKTVCDRYLAEPERWGKSVFYWRTEAEANECHRRLLAAGTRAGLVLGTQSFDQREQTLEQFEDNGLDAMVNLFILTEGWDFPALQTAWVRDSSRGPTTQMAGRAFRKHKDLPFKQIVQSSNTHYPVEKIVAPEQGYVWSDTEWRSVKPDDSADRVAAVAMMLIAQTTSELPEFIRKKNAKSGRRRRANTGGPLGDN